MTSPAATKCANARVPHNIKILDLLTGHASLHGITTVYATDSTPGSPTRQTLSTELHVITQTSPHLSNSTS